VKLKPPKVGDLVKRGQRVGIVERKTGLGELKVRWLQRQLDGNGDPISVGWSWHRRGDLEVISSAPEKKQKTS